MEIVDWYFRVHKLENGYVLAQTDKQPVKGKYVPDMEGLIREFALTVGGEDAVPLTPVSAEEAGLLEEPILPFGGWGQQGGTTEWYQRERAGIASQPVGSFTSDCNAHGADSAITNTGAIAVSVQPRPGADNEEKE
jgi:hypothetical protein